MRLHGSNPNVSSKTSSDVGRVPTARNEWNWPERTYVTGACRG